MASMCVGDDRAGLVVGGSGGGGGLRLGEVDGGGGGGVLIGNTMPFFFQCMMELTASPSVSTPSLPGMSSRIILQAA